MTTRTKKLHTAFRLTALALSRLSDLKEGSGRSPAVIVDDAIIEYFRRHPEFWPDRLFPGWTGLEDGKNGKHDDSDPA